MIKMKRLLPLVSNIIKRGACGSGGNRRGLVLGTYNGCSPGEFKLTKAAEAFDQSINGKLSELLKGTGVPLGESLCFTNLSEEYYSVAVGGLGEEGVSYDSLEKLNVCKENIRTAAGISARKLLELGMGTIFVEEFTNMEAAAEGAALSIWQYQDLLSPSKRKPNAALEPYKSADPERWQRGLTKAEAQNLARYVEEVPANIMTPRGFTEQCLESLCPCGIQVDVHDRDWMETRRMNSILTIANTSCEPPLVVELKYCGGDAAAKPVVIVGKGITYDSGSLCLKNKKVMSEYRADMAGAAVVLGALRCIARMALPINVIGVVPLCENMIGGLSTRPGDVITAANGKTIMIQDTGNEGRVLLADALSYCKIHVPCLVGTVATLTPGMRATLGSGATGVFTNSNEVWMQIEIAGSETGDRMWRFPSFWDIYRRKITEMGCVDVCNVGLQPGNTCQAAAFLKEFLHQVDFFHADITGTGMLSTGVGHPYLKEGVMTGRPTRTVAQLLYQIACPHEPGTEC